MGLFNKIINFSFAEKTLYFDKLICYNIIDILQVIKFEFTR